RRRKPCAAQSGRPAHQQGVRQVDTRPHRPVHLPLPQAEVTGCRLPRTARQPAGRSRGDRPAEPDPAEGRIGRVLEVQDCTSRTSGNGFCSLLDAASYHRVMHTLRFDNRFLRELPGDPSDAPGPREVTGACYSRVTPTPVAAPRLLAHSAEMALTLGFDAGELASDAFAQVFGGNALLPGMQPWAANYGGHQFGVWAGQLGDGRAISLGEAVASNGERWE